MAYLNSIREVQPNLSYFFKKDLLVIREQMAGRNFQNELVLGVSARCRWGMPQVLCCRPYHKNEPFPTLFWLTCPHLSHICGTLESLGGVGEFERWLVPRQAEYRAYNTLYALTRLKMLSQTEKYFLSRYQGKLMEVLRKTGIGGIRANDKLTVKCLHLQLATSLSLAGHPGQKWLSEKIPALSCSDGRCLACLRRI